MQQDFIEFRVAHENNPTLGPGSELEGTDAVGRRRCAVDSDADKEKESLRLSVL